VRLPCRDRSERPGGGQRKVALERLARFRVMTRQGERRNQERRRRQDSEIGDRARGQRRDGEADREAVSDQTLQGTSARGRLGP